MALLLREDREVLEALLRKDPSLQAVLLKNLKRKRDALLAFDPRAWRTIVQDEAAMIQKEYAL